MKTCRKGTILTNKLSIELPQNTLIKCIKTHSWIFDSGLSKRELGAKKGETDRLGYIPLQEENWIVLKDTKY